MVNARNPFQRKDTGRLIVFTRRRRSQKGFIMSMNVQSCHKALNPGLVKAWEERELFIPFSIFF